jgi:uncharacterized protein YjbJ (UPF0337 family)
LACESSIEEGIFHKIKGKLNEIAGELRDSPKLEAACTHEKISGTIQHIIGQGEKSLGNSESDLSAIGLSLDSRQIRCSYSNHKRRNGYETV